MILATFFLIFIFMLRCIHSLPQDCLTLNKKLSALDNRLNTILNKSYSVQDEEFEYFFGVCTTPKAFLATHAGSGLLQQSLKDRGKIFSIGSYNHTERFDGTNTIILMYNEGDAYPNHCAKTKRRAIIIMSCNPALSDAKFSIVKEHKDETTGFVGGCYYLFELEHKSLCSSKSVPIVPVVPNSKAATVSQGVDIIPILLIVIIVGAVLYLCVGVIVKRVAFGAKGMNQIPNYEMWRKFGNLCADGCVYVCRSEPPTPEHLRNQQGPFGGLGDDQLNNPEHDDDDRDDHLLPM